MAASIGTLAGILTLNDADFQARLASAMTKLKEMQAAQAPPGGGAAGGGGLAAGFAGGLAAGALTEVISLAERAGQALVGMAQEGLSAGVQTTRLAAELGTSTEEMSALLTAASRVGIDQGMLAHGLLRIQSLIGEASQGAVEARIKFAALGLDVGKLAGQGAGDQLAAIAAALAKIPAGAARAAAGKEIFGQREYARLAPLIAELAGGMEKAEAAARRFGTSLSTADSAKLMGARAALSDLQETLAGIGLQLAVKFAPAIKELVGHFVDWANAGQSAGETVSYYAMGAAGALADLGDAVIAVGRFFWENLYKPGTQALIGMLTMVGKVHAAWSKLVGLRGGGEVEAGLAESAAGLEKRIDDMVKAHQPGELAQAVQHLFAPGGEALPKPPPGAETTGVAVAKLTAKLQEQIDTFGMDSTAIELYHLKMAGASAANLAAAEGLEEYHKKLERIMTGAIAAGTMFQETQRRINALMGEVRRGQLGWDAYGESVKKLNEELAKKEDSAVARMIEENSSDLDKFNNKLAEMNQFIRDGKLTADQAALALLKMTQAAGAGAEYKLAGAMTKDSKEAVSAFTKYSVGARSTPQERANQLLEELRDKAKMQLEAARAIQRALERAGAVVPVPMPP